MKPTHFVPQKYDMTLIANAINDMCRACGGGDVPAKLVKATARQLHLTPREFSEAAARLNRPFAASHVR